MIQLREALLLFCIWEEVMMKKVMCAATNSNPSLSPSKHHSAQQKAAYK